MNVALRAVAAKGLETVSTRQMSQEARLCVPVSGCTALLGWDLGDPRVVLMGPCLAGWL